VRVYNALQVADAADVTLQQLRGFMNIDEGGEGTGGAAAAATTPTPPVHPDHDDRYLMEGGEAACVRGWEQGGYVALANFNQVQYPPCFLCSKRFLIALFLSALQDHACVRAHVVRRYVEVAALLLHAAQGLHVYLCSYVWLSHLVCEFEFHSRCLQFLSNPDTDASIRSLLGGARGAGHRVTFAPFVTDKEQFLSVAQVKRL
jgi:hypothetical protein